MYNNASMLICILVQPNRFSSTSVRQARPIAAAAKFVIYLLIHAPMYAPQNICDSSTQPGHSGQLTAS
jgi:hypothetical protein